MGQKTHPIGFRLGISKDWRSRWFASEKDFPALLKEDALLRKYLKARLGGAVALAVIGRLECLQPFVVQALGGKFDLRDFNDAVVQTGGVPLTVLETAIDAFVARTNRA